MNCAATRPLPFDSARWTEIEKSVQRRRVPVFSFLATNSHTAIKLRKKRRARNLGASPGAVSIAVGMLLSLRYVYGCKRSVAALRVWMIATHDHPENSQISLLVAPAAPPRYDGAAPPDPRHLPECSCTPARRGRPVRATEEAAARQQRVSRGSAQTGRNSPPHNRVYHYPQGPPRGSLTHPFGPSWARLGLATPQLPHPPHPGAS